MDCCHKSKHTVHLYCAHSTTLYTAVYLQSIKSKADHDSNLHVCVLGLELDTGTLQAKGKYTPRLLIIQ